MPRRGVSLLEVLFAIGAIAVGLLGVIAIFPLALNQIGQGITADRSRQVGLNAVERFTAHGMNRPDQWVWFDRIGNRQAVGHPSELNTKPDTATPPQATLNPALLPDGANTAFVIDPQFIAVNQSTVSTTPPRDARLFPYYPRANFTSGGGTYPAIVDTRLRRITLGPERDSTAVTGSTRPAILRLPHAAAIFTDGDELVFDVPDERTLRPVQLYGSTLDGAGNTIVASPLSSNPSALPGSRRQYQGRISWLATLVPQLDVTNAYATPSDLYLLSIVVFNNRDSSFAMNTTNERIVEVDTFFNAGLGGGDVNLAASGTDPVGQLDLNRGEWILLMATAQPMIPASSGPPPTSARAGVPLCRWYRVVETEEAPRLTSPTTAERYVTLQGADWPAQYLAVALPTTASAPAKPATATRAVLMSNIVTVYERTIRLETSGTWSY